MDRANVKDGMMAARTMRIWAGEKTSGERVDEEVLVEEVGEGRWRLIASPGLAQGIAADDVIELDEAGVHGRSVAREILPSMSLPPQTGETIFSPG